MCTPSASPLHPLHPIRHDRLDTGIILTLCHVRKEEYDMHLVLAIVVAASICAALGVGGLRWLFGAFLVLLGGTMAIATVAFVVMAEFPP